MVGWDHLLFGAWRLARSLLRPAGGALGRTKRRRRGGAPREREREPHARGRRLQRYEAGAVGALGRDGAAAPYLLAQRELAPLRRACFEPLGRGEGCEPPWRAKGVLRIVWVGRLGHAAIARVAAARLVHSDQGRVEYVLRVLGRVKVG